MLPQQQKKYALLPLVPRAPLPRADVLSAIEATALRYGSHTGLRRAGLSVSDWLLLFRANIEIESAYRQRAVSSAGAIGLGQLMPATARDLGVDPRDPLQNLDGSACYLAMMLELFGSQRLALAAYNAGPDAVRQYGGIPLTEKPKIMWPASWRWSLEWKEQTHEAFYIPIRSIIDVVLDSRGTCTCAKHRSLPDPKPVAGHRRSAARPAWCRDCYTRSSRCLSQLVLQHH